jgi:hypothetical protein
LATREEVGAELATVFEELVDLVNEVKQAAWTASSADRRRTIDEFRTFVVEQAATVDEAELRISERPAWVRNPTGHHWRNITSDAHGDADLVVTALVRDIDATVEDIRRHSLNVDGEARQLLDEVAEGLARRCEELRGA